MAKRGPNTPAGKAIVSLNAVSHGALSNAVIVPGIESLEEWESFRDELLRDLAPVGAVDHRFAGQVAMFSWRLRRIPRHEAQMISVYLEDAERDYAVSAAYRDKPASVDQAEQSLETTRAAAQLIRKVGELPDDARIPVEVCLEILDNSGGDEDALLAALQADGVAGVDRWTAARLRAALETLSGAGADLAALIDDIRDSLDDAIPRRQDAIVETRAEIQRLRRHRTLPEESILHNIARYEAHLSRQFYRAYHELEALQARRMGHPSNISRLQVHGMPGG